MRYLLGGAADAELAVLEERILTDDDFYQELLIAEDELIDQYLLDTLSESERSKFVSHFLISPERQEKLRFSKTLKRYVTAAEVPEDSAGLVPAAGVSTRPAEAVPAGGHSTPPVEVVPAGGDSTRPVKVVPAGGDSTRPTKVVPAGGHPTRKRWFESYIPITGRPSVDAIFGNRLALATLSLLIVATVSVVLTNRLSRQRSVSPEDFYVAQLTPGLTRDSGETNRIRIPPDKKMVRLELQLESLPGSYQSYTAELKTSDSGSTLLHRDNLLSEVKGNHQVVNLDVPAEDLRPGDYHLRLSGLPASGTPEPIGRYSFRITN